MGTGPQGFTRKPARGANLAGLALALDKSINEQQKMMEAQARTLLKLQELVIRVRRTINEEG